MFTWLLLPLGLSLTLSASGPVVTGELHGVPRAIGACPAIGSVAGMQVGLTAVCEYPADIGFLGGVTLPGAGSVEIVLTIDPGTFDGAWLDSFGRSGTAHAQ